MLIENAFDVQAPIEEVWAYMLDVEKVVVCMPGAQLTETVDERNYKGKVTVKLGPVSLSFAGRVELTERDEDSHKMVLKGKGQEARGKGAAQATITATLTTTDSGTNVAVEQDLIVTGQAAQLSRGMMQDVSQRLSKQFADCLESNIGAQREAAPGEAPAPLATAQPVQGLSVGFGALMSAVGRFFKNLLGRSSAK